MIADETTDDGDSAVATIAAAIGEPARAKMLYSLMDGRARTSTELSAIADVMPSTASGHLGRLLDNGLVSVLKQGKHRYYRISTAEVGMALEGLRVLAGAGSSITVRTPGVLRNARSCYDHLAGRLGVALHDELCRSGVIVQIGSPISGYEITEEGCLVLLELGIDVSALRRQRRRFAYACLDWSERKPHLAGALGAALLTALLSRGWLERDPDSRAVSLTHTGKGQMGRRFGVTLESGN